MSENKITVTYDGVEITYVEYTNKWNFELRGRERNVDSLTAAKEAIDKPEPVKKKPFTRIPAFVLESNYNSIAKFIPVEVTSVAESPSYRTTQQVWIVGPKGKREQKDAPYVYADTPENKMQMAKYVADSKIISGLNEQLKETLQGIAAVEVPNE